MCIKYYNIISESYIYTISEFKLFQMENINQVASSSNLPESISSVNIKREAFRQNKFDNQFKLIQEETKNKEPNVLKDKLKKWYNPSKLIEIFTVFNLIATYDKKNLVAVNIVFW